MDEPPCAGSISARIVTATHTNHLTLQSQTSDSGAHECIPKDSSTQYLPAQFICTSSCMAQLVVDSMEWKDRRFGHKPAKIGLPATDRLEKQPAFEWKR